MYSFLIKKTFFDMWDNLLAVFLMSTGFILLVCGFFILPSWLGLPSVFLTLYAAAGVVLVSFYNGAMYRCTLDFSDFKKAGFVLFLQYFVRSWKESLVNSIAGLIMLAVVFYVFPFYFSNDSILLVVIGTVIFWAWFTAFLASLFFFPSSVRLKKKLLPNIRFCFSFVMDNIGFCLFMLLILILIMVLSVVILFLIPGMATVFLWINVCFRIRLYKYYYLEAHPGADRRSIPWDELIAEDEAAVGKRTLRGLIFPWRQ